MASLQFSAAYQTNNTFLEGNSVTTQGGLLDAASGGLKYVFVGEPAGSKTFTDTSGNNVIGTLFVYNDKNEVVSRYYGEISRQIKVQGAVEAFQMYVYPSGEGLNYNQVASKTILLDVGSRPLDPNTLYGTSSDFKASVLNSFIDTNKPDPLILFPTDGGDPSGGGGTPPGGGGGTIPGETLNGGGGDDNETGGGGDDIISGGGGDDTENGGDGNDTIFGGDGNDDIIGGGGNDAEDGGGGNDKIYGDNGKDILDGGDGDDFVDGGNGNDHINGDNGKDTLVGGDGSDTLNGGKDADTLVGGNGDDSYFVDNKGDKIVEASAPAGGVDTIVFENNLDPVCRWDFLSATDGVENYIYNGTSFFHFNGNDLDNLIIGGDQDDIINGLGGNDTIYGLGGNDQLSGGVGNDVLFGDAGADIQTGGEGHDVFQYRQATDSAPGASDLITDFVSGQDKIDLSLMDANASTEEREAFTFIGQTSAPVSAGQVSFWNGSVFGNSGAADGSFQIKLAGVASLNGSDFNL